MFKVKQDLPYFQKALLKEGQASLIDKENPIETKAALPSKTAPKAKISQLTQAICSMPQTAQLPIQGLVHNFNQVKDPYNMVEANPLKVANSSYEIPEVTNLL